MCLCTFCTPISNMNTNCDLSSNTHKYGDYKPFKLPISDIAQLIVLMGNI